MSDTNYYKTVKLTVMEAAMVDSALAAHADQLARWIEETGLPAISVSNMKRELAAVQSALEKIAFARAAA